MLSGTDTHEWLLTFGTGAAMRQAIYTGLLRIITGPRMSTSEDNRVLRQRDVTERHEYDQDCAQSEGELAEAEKRYGTRTIPFRVAKAPSSL